MSAEVMEAPTNPLKDAGYAALVRMPSGNWLKFSHMNKARAFVMDDDKANILTHPDQLLVQYRRETVEDMYRDMVKMPVPKGMSDDDLSLNIFQFLVQTAKDPHSINTEKEQKQQAKASKAKGKSAPKVKRSDLKFYCKLNLQDPKHKKEFDALPRQAQVCLTTFLEETKGDPNLGFNESYMQDMVTKIGERLKTRQDPWRIWKYYMSKFVGLGFVCRK